MQEIERTCILKVALRIEVCSLCFIAIEFQKFCHSTDAFLVLHTYVFSKNFVAVNNIFTGRYWYGANMQRNMLIRTISIPILQHLVF